MASYFCTDNVDEVSAEDVQDYPLPFNPEMLVRVQSVPMNRMKQYHDAVSKGGAVAIAAQKSLIRDSIINPDGSPVYKDSAKAEAMLKGRTRLVSALIQIISLHNGGEDKVTNEADTAEKKSVTTA